MRAISAICAAALAFAAFAVVAAKASLIPPLYLDHVVALGTIQPIGQPPHLAWVTEGTGFFYGALIKDDPEPAKRLYQIFLVTARHVVEHHDATHGEMQVRINPRVSSAPGQQFALPTKPGPGVNTWFFHPNPQIDIAAIQINVAFLNGHGIDAKSIFFESDIAAANRSKLQALGVSAGDGVFVLGFPMNLAGEQRNYVIVRQGIVARISEMLEQSSPNFLIDALVYPGNSGSPVILKPDILSISGTKAQNNSLLIGVVTDYLTYVDAAYSQQTRRARITFEENSGLATVIPVDYIDDAIAAWRKTQQNNLLAAPTK